MTCFEWLKKGVVAIYVGWLVVAACVFLAKPAWPQAQPYPQQCVTNALAGGTPNAITTQALPCALTTNLLILTASAANTSTMVTIQPLGIAAERVTRADGTPLAIGDITGPGYIALLTPTGSTWALLNPGNITEQIPASAVEFQPPGSPPPNLINLQTRGTFQSFARDYGASGSVVTGTATTQAASLQVTLDAVHDFQIGQGLLIDQAGLAAPLSQPTFTVTVNGSTGSTHYCYDMAAVDGNGGYTAVTQHCITNGNATLTATNNNTLNITPPVGSKSTIIWRSAASTGPWTYWGSTDTTSFTDTGFQAPNQPWWVSNTPAAKNDWFVSTITAINGTVFTLAAAPINTISVATRAQHDDTAAINFGLALGGPTQLLISCGQYNISSAIILPASGTGVIGWGPCTQIFAQGVNNDFNLLGGSPGSPFVGNFVENLDVDDTGKVAGAGISSTNSQALLLANLQFTAPYEGIFLQDFSNLNAYNISVFNFFGQDGFIMAMTSDATHNSQNADITDITGTGNGGLIGDLTVNAKGFWIDGNVSHMATRNLFAGSVMGPGLLVSNIIGNATAPTVLQMDRFRADSTNGRGVDLEAGTGPDFSGILLSNTNIVYSSCPNSAGFYVGANPTFWSIEGGSITTSKGDGIFVNGKQGALRPTTVSANSQTGAGTCPGIEFGATSKFVSLTGVVIGAAATSTFQTVPILIDSGALDLAIVGNVYAGNVANTVTDSSGSNTNQYALNAGDTNYSLEVSTNGTLSGQSVYSTGVQPVASGSCAVKTQAGGQFAGTFTSNGGCSGGTIILTFQNAATANGWSCTAKDLTTPADSINPTSYTTMAVTFTATMAANDLATFTCVGF